VPGTQNIFDFKAEIDIALVVGSETYGLVDDILKKCIATLEIPMRGTKNSLNVSVAVGIALYCLI
jgi:tRNA G18 (ribose-2'-O)-methylase SpoU